MQYQVLARKWRPQNFHELVGQEHVSRTLLNALQSNRVAHAFLFSGPRGSGKTTTARILAKALNCHSGQPGEPCGNCAACTEIAAGNCIDVLEIDAASNTGVDNVRQLIEQARYNPARDRNKIFIIDEVHMLSNAAFAALLKTLEEPPARVVFILATTEYHKIPATILSRCQQYSFKLIQYPLILERLRLIASSEGIQISSSALEQVVFASGGSMRDAMSALDQVIAFSGNTVKDEDVATLLGLVEPKVLGQAVRSIAGGDLSTILKIVRDLVETGQDLHNFCRRLSGQFRNLMVLKAGISDPALLGVPESMLPDLREQAELFSREDLLRLFDAFQRIETAMKYATQVRFQLEMGLIELAQIARLRSLEDLIADFSAGPGSGSTPGRLPPDSGRPKSNPGTEASPGNATVPAAPPSQPPARTPVIPNPKELLLEIAAAVGRESLESLMQNLAGARLESDKVVLEFGSANDFVRLQITENLSVITDAATKVVGRNVKVVPNSSFVPMPQKSVSSRRVPENVPQDDLLEKVKREPVVKSFLDVFPGPVKAEKIDP